MAGNARVPKPGLPAAKTGGHPAAPSPLQTRPQLSSPPQFLPLLTPPSSGFKARCSRMQERGLKSFQRRILPLPLPSLMSHLLARTHCCQLLFLLASPSAIFAPPLFSAHLFLSFFTIYLPAFHFFNFN